jgi:hypothetical protein
MDTIFKDTDVMVMKADLGKNLYRKKTYYTLVVEQDVLANNKAEADHKFMDFGGINHSMVNAEITDEKEGVTTYMVDANYTDGASTDYLGKVTYTDDEFAEEMGDVEINRYVEENGQ